MATAKLTGTFFIGEPIKIQLLSPPPGTKIGHVVWECKAQQDSATSAHSGGSSEETNKKWKLAVEHARPFPWNPQEFVPVADMLGLLVRAAIILIDEDTEKPIADAKPILSEPSPPIQLSSKLRTIVSNAMKKNQFGFHASSSEGPERYVVLVSVVDRKQIEEERVVEKEEKKVNQQSEESKEEVEKSKKSEKMAEEQRLTIEVKAIDDDDKKAMRRVFFGVCSEPRSCCSLCTSDEVTMNLHLSQIIHHPGAVLGRMREKGNSAQQTEGQTVAAVEEKDSSSTFPNLGSAEAANQTSSSSFSLCVRSRNDRDLCTLILRARQAAWLLEHQQGKELRTTSNEKGLRDCEHWDEILRQVAAIAQQ